MPIFNRVHLNLIVQLAFYAVVLFADLRMMDWYKDFYQSIQEKSVQGFYFQVQVFVLIVLVQSIMLGCISYNTDLYEASLKRFFVNSWVSRNSFALLSSHTVTKLDQRIIDDAAFAAERFSSLLPTLIFNSIKCLVFLFLLAGYKTNISELLGLNNYWDGSFGLCLFGVLYLGIQIFIVAHAGAWVNKSENIKRRAEAAVRYKLISNNQLSNLILNAVQSYVKRIVKIRKIVGRAHGLNVLSINLISLMTVIVPFIFMFSFYLSNEIDFGDLMKISATYAGFQSSALYVFNFYKEFFRGLSAIGRLNAKLH